VQRDERVELREAFGETHDRLGQRELVEEEYIPTSVVSFSEMFDVADDLTFVPDD